MGKCACGNWCCGGGWTGGVALSPKHHLEALIVEIIVSCEGDQETEKVKSMYCMTDFDSNLFVIHDKKAPSFMCREKKLVHCIFCYTLIFYFSMAILISYD